MPAEAYRWKRSSSRMFESICERFTKREGVTLGKMMSSPGLKYRGKVFAFFHRDKMVFKLGEGFDMRAFGVDNYSLLSPFKTKPPLKAWIEVPASESRHWEALTERALEFAAKG